MNEFRQFSISARGILGLVMIILGFVLLFFIARGIFQILAWLAPFLIVGALIVNYRTVIGYGKFIVRLIRRNVLGGLLAIILTVIGFPIVAGLLFGKAFLDRRIARLSESRRPAEEFVDYEDVTEEESYLELRELSENPSEESDYDDLLDEDNT